MRRRAGLLVVLLAGALAVPARADAPAATTLNAFNILETDAVVGGALQDGGEPATFRFAYGTTPEYGLATAWTAVPAGATNVTARLTGLRPATAYHARLEVQNASGTALGADTTFTTAKPRPAARKVRFADVVRFPRTGCSTRGRLTLRLRMAGEDRQLKRVVISVDGRRRKTLTGFRRSAKVELKGLRRRARVGVSALLADGTRVSGRRTIRACRSRGR